MRNAMKWAAMGFFCAGLALAAEDKKADDQPKTDQEFLKKAIACDTAEIKMGAMAQKMATNQGVQRFAQKMVTDHTNNRATLAAIGKALKLDVAEVEMKEHKAEMEKLSKLDKKDFDRAYIKSQVEGHEKALKMYEAWAKESKDENFRTAATKALLVVRHHLEEARKLATDAGTGGTTKDSPTKDK